MIIYQKFRSVVSNIKQIGCYYFRKQSKKTCGKMYSSKLLLVVRQTWRVLLYNIIYHALFFSNIESVEILILQYFELTGFYPVEIMVCRNFAVGVLNTYRILLLGKDIFRQEVTQNTMQYNSGFGPSLNQISDISR